MLTVKEQQYSDISSRSNQSLCFPLHVTKYLKTFLLQISYFRSTDRQKFNGEYVQLLQIYFCALPYKSTPPHIKGPDIIPTACTAQTVNLG